MVHVFERTGVEKEGLRNVGWFGKVVGREGGVFLVRNWLLAAKGCADLVEGEFMKLQADFGLECGSGERVHFLTLSKRTRDRILLSSDERNNWEAKSAKKELVTVKKQKTQQKDAYLLRREKMLTQGSSTMQQKTTGFEHQLKYWQEKSETSQKKMKTSQDNNKRTSQKVQVATIPHHAFISLWFSNLSKGKYACGARRTDTKDDGVFSPEGGTTFLCLVLLGLVLCLWSCVLLSCCVLSCCVLSCYVLSCCVLSCCVLSSCVFVCPRCFILLTSPLSCSPHRARRLLSTNYNSLS
jgi:hypothetical protein